MAWNDSLNQKTRDFLANMGDHVIGSKYLYVVHGPKGEILDIVNRDNEHFGLIARELLEAKTLSRYFELSDLKEGRSFPQKTRFQWHPNIFELFTTLPETGLITRRLEQDIYLGRISFADFLPNIASQRIFSFIFSDVNKDTLIGFTPNFYGMFRQAYPSPMNLLNLPLSSFFSPTPAAFQKAMLPRFDLREKDAFRPVYEKDFTRDSVGPLEEILFADAADRRERGLVWEKKGPGQSYLTVLKEISSLERDIVVSLTFESHEGLGPYMVLGSRYLGEDRLPDNVGYFAGPQHDAENEFTLKRDGFIIASGAAREPVHAKATYHFCKIGCACFLYRNQTRLAAFYDNNFKYNAHAFVTLGLRSGYRCVLQKLSVLVREPASGPKPAAPRRQIIEMKTAPPCYYTLDRFFNFALTQAHLRHAAGYFLGDVTEMQDRISDLGHQVRAQVRREEKLKSLLKKYEDQDREFIGSGPVMAVVKETARTVAASAATVLIEGPTGSGKEVLARFIHGESPQREGPFIKVDCSTVPQGLIESHLFGHEKGAFTGAVEQSIGMFEKADKGTLFLDEVGNLSPEVQAKLLQFLNDFTISRVGGTRPVRLDVRCIVASNISLEQMVREGAFREDLYFRINVVYLKVPPLRERKEDVPALCRRFLNVFNGENNKTIKGFSPAAVRKLEEYSWPGNVRELKNVIQRAVIFCQDDTISSEYVQFTEAGGAPPAPARKIRTPFYMDRTDEAYVVSLLKKHLGKAVDVAREMGISRGTLYKYLKARKIDINGFRKGFGG